MTDSIPTEKSLLFALDRINEYANGDNTDVPTETVENALDLLNSIDNDTTRVSSAVLIDLKHDLSKMKTVSERDHESIDAGAVSDRIVEYEYELETNGYI